MRHRRTGRLHLRILGFEVEERESSVAFHVGRVVRARGDRSGSDAGPLGLEQRRHARRLVVAHLHVRVAVGENRVPNRTLLWKAPRLPRDVAVVGVRRGRRACRPYNLATRARLVRADRFPREASRAGRAARVVRAAHADRIPRQVMDEGVELGRVRVVHHLGLQHENAKKNRRVFEKKKDYLAMNVTVRVGQRLCAHDAFLQRNCLIVSQPFYTAFLPLILHGHGRTPCRGIGVFRSVARNSQPVRATVHRRLDRSVDLHRAQDTLRCDSAVPERPSARPTGARAPALPRPHRSDRLRLRGVRDAVGDVPRRVDPPKRDVGALRVGHAARRREWVAAGGGGRRENVPGGGGGRDATAGRQRVAYYGGRGAGAGIDVSVWLGSGGALLVLLGVCGCARSRRRKQNRRRKDGGDSGEGRDSPSQAACERLRAFFFSLGIGNHSQACSDGTRHCSPFWCPPGTRRGGCRNTRRQAARADDWMTDTKNARQ